MFYSYLTLAVIILISTLMLRRKQTPMGQQAATKSHVLANTPIEQLPKHIQTLHAELPECVILQSDAKAFQQAIDYSWAQQNREIIPACIVRPHNTQELSHAVKILKKEHNSCSQAQTPITGFFSIRSGGVNPGVGAATVQNGVMIDLSLFCDITPAADGSTVTLGTGAKWIDVYKKLDEKGLIVIGGRNSPIGVGGLTLQGGISFYSPRFGFVCSNAVSYEVVLASGNIVTASTSENPELWRVLKGGGNNFGIVTRFTLRSLPSEPVWNSQTIALAAFQQTKALKVYHDYLKYASSGEPGAFDENAAVPIMSFVYLQRIGFQLISLNLHYTKAQEDKKWPAHWKRTGFKSLWSLYRSDKVMSHTNCVEAFGRTAAYGTRHVLATTTIRNDFETMKAAYAIFCETTATKLRHIKNLRYPFIFQAILPGWMNKGHPNILGLEGCTEPLIIIGLSLTWEKVEDDELVRSTACQTLEQINKAATARQADHPYRFINYCMDWQQPYEGCSKENLELMRQASHKYDPDGFFQTGRFGVFKIPDTSLQ